MIQNDQRRATRATNAEQSDENKIVTSVSGKMIVKHDENVQINESVYDPYLRGELAGDPGRADDDLSRRLRKRSTSLSRLEGEVNYRRSRTRCQLTPMPSALNRRLPVLLVASQSEADRLHFAADI